MCILLNRVLCQILNPAWFLLHNSSNYEVISNHEVTHWKRKTFVVKWQYFIQLPGNLQSIQQMINTYVTKSVKDMKGHGPWTVNRVITYNTGFIFRTENTQALDELYLQTSGKLKHMTEPSRRGTSFTLLPLYHWWKSFWYPVRLRVDEFPNRCECDGEKATRCTFHIVHKVVVLIYGIYIYRLYGCDVLDLIRRGNNQRKARSLKTSKTQAQQQSMG
jgi:hypothetical protein